MSNELHVPTMGRIRDDYIEAWAGHFMDGEKGAAEYFDQAMGRLLTQVRAAAEQRGAEQVIDHIRAEANDAAGQEWLHPDQELSDMADWLEERHRADRIANKEGER